MKANTPFSLYSVLLFLALFGGVSTHMNVHSPPPRTYKGNPFVTSDTADYSINAPLNPANNKPFPCAGTRKSRSVLTVKPGNSINVQLEGGAPHNGGHCEFSISYDGQRFVSIQTVIRECLRAAGTSYSVPLPPSLPGGPAVFAWTWVNAEGNREFYMNCMDVTIDAPATGSLVGPEIVVANLPGYPSVPEMINGADDMRSLYSNRPNVEIAPTPGSNQIDTTSTDTTSTYTPSTDTTSTDTTSTDATSTDKSMSNSDGANEECANASSDAASPDTTSMDDSSNNEMMDAASDTASSDKSPESTSVPNLTTFSGLDGVPSSSDNCDDEDENATTSSVDPTSTTVPTTTTSLTVLPSLTTTRTMSTSIVTSTTMDECDSPFSVQSLTPSYSSVLPATTSTIVPATSTPSQTLPPLLSTTTTTSTTTVTATTITTITITSSSIVLPTGTTTDDCTLPTSSVLPLSTATTETTTPVVVPTPDCVCDDAESDDAESEDSNDNSE